jgi:putative spermidine/putrescine transport system substrate-binding protein
MSAHKTALLSALTTALLASASLQAAEPLKAVGAGEGQLDIVAWPGYIERGESDKTGSPVSRRKPAARSM